MGKGIPADHCKVSGEEGFSARLWSDCESVHGSRWKLLGYGPEAAKLSSVSLSQKQHTNFMGAANWSFCWHALSQSRREGKSGGYLTSDCRGNLRRATTNLREKHRYKASHRGRTE